MCRYTGIDPEDLAQETLERALPRLDLTSKAHEGQSVAWLIRTLQNLFLDKLRRHLTEERALPQLTLLTPHTDPQPAEAGAWTKVSDQDLVDAMDQLPSRQREIFQLHLTELKPQQIAAELGIDKNTVYVQLHHARKKLRALLRSEPDEGE